LYGALKQRHILVRYFASPGLDDKLRISVGTHDENTRLISTLREIL
ncbi:MAG: histidinol-phosphate transaminase, partial [Gammaproteobacteria bacterium]